MWAFANLIGVHASNEQVGEFIHSLPGVRDPVSGRFSTQAYEQFVAQNNYSVAEFEREIRGDLSQQLLMQALVVGVRAPASYGALALAYESERRTITIAEAPIALAGNVPAPDATQMQAFYEENHERLQTPEYRGVTLVLARIRDFMAQVDVPEERIREEFEARRSALARPETRTLAQLSAPDEASARQAADRLAAGESPEAIAAALGLQAVAYEGRQREAVADSAVAEAAFAMNIGDAPRVVRGRLSPWAVVELIGVTPSVEARYEDLHDSLRDEIAEIEASDMRDEAIATFEEARAGGTPIADAARAARLGVVQTPSVTAQGVTPDGRRVAEFEAAPELLRMAFETPEGEASDFMPAGDDVDVVVSVDRIIPVSVRPLEEVRDDLEEAWLMRERVRRLNEIRDEIVAAVEGGESFTAAARARRVPVVVTSQPIDRQRVQQLPARQLGMLIFDARVNEVVSDTRNDGGAVLMAQVERIERADPAENAEQMEQARLQLQQTLGESLVEALTYAAQVRVAPKRNNRLLERTFAPSAGSADAP
jgi:peptidyl-prolyl cis-trans isomerase D